MAEERDKKQAADADLALTDKEAADVKGGRKVKKKGKKRKTGGNAAGGRFQPM